MGMLNLHKEMSENEMRVIIGEMVANMDLNMIERVMNAENWRWSTRIGDDGEIPHRCDIYKSFINKSVEVISRLCPDSKVAATLCGGIMVHAELFDEGDIGLNLYFVLEWENNYL